jgi:hypothetical protein
MFDRTALDRLDARSVVDAAVACRRAADRAEADLLLVAAQFADLHPALDGPRAGYGDPALRVVDGAESSAPLAGTGTPHVAEFAPEQLAAALGTTGHNAKVLVGEALELRHRLPRLWTLVLDGRLQAWKARQVAAETIPLSREAADFVDRHVAVIAARNRLPQVRALVHEALLRCDPEVAAGREQAALDQRGVWLDHRESTATTRLTIVADTPDALAFDASVCEVAAGLGRLGDTDPLDVRRARAVGVLADPQRSLDLLSGGDGSATPMRPREAMLYLHLDAGGDETMGTGMGEVGRADGLGAATRDLLRAWLGDLDRVTVRPVLRVPFEGSAETSATGYAPSPRMREQVVLRDPTCVFPGCTVLSRSCDLDHVVPYDPDSTSPGEGATHADNLAPLCRRHHRVKTHGRWRYLRRRDGTFAWTDPGGRAYVVDAAGTRHPPDPAGGTQPAA